jgi:hypothetical protein
VVGGRKVRTLVVVALGGLVIGLVGFVLWGASRDSQGPRAQDLPIMTVALVVPQTTTELVAVRGSSVSSTDPTIPPTSFSTSGSPSSSGRSTSRTRVAEAQSEQNRTSSTSAATSAVRESQTLVQQDAAATATQPPAQPFAQTAPAPISPTTTGPAIGPPTTRTLFAGVAIAGPQTQTEPAASSVSSGTEGRTVIRPPIRETEEEEEGSK